MSRQSREQERVAGVIRDAASPTTSSTRSRAAGWRQPDRDDDLPTRVTDYLAGMTDRFCIREFEELTVPREFRY